MKGRILIVDDEESIRFTFRSFLEDDGYAAETAVNYGQAVRKLDNTEFDVAYVDIILGSRSGIDLLRSVKREYRHTQVIIITGAPSVDSAAEAVRLGALDYIVKPVRQDTLLRTAGMALKHKALLDAKEKYRRNLQAIFRSVKDGLITVNPDLDVLEINSAAERICGVERKKALGQPLSTWLTGCSGKCLDAMSRTIHEKKSIEVRHIECFARHRNGQVVSVSTTPLLNQDGKNAGGVMVVRDETRLVALERSLDEQLKFNKFVGNSPSIRKIHTMIKALADVQTSVLLTGESGTGKELVAEALHAVGNRRDKPLVKVNCSALSESLLESELFGHVQGAFTGAVRDKVGRFQRADGGTIFLDEIGDISMRMQLRFLRVLEEMEFERVGDSKPIRVDVRVVAATNRVLKDRVAESRFREDLYYRLKVVDMRMPPLREHREDIPLLVNHILKQFNRKFDKTINAVSAAVMDMFKCYAWPGNVRELKNTLEHAFVLCRYNTITRQDLPPELIKRFGSDRPSSKAGKSYEARAIRHALEQTAHNKTEAARILGISRRTLYRRMARCGIKP